MFLNDIPGSICYFLIYDYASLWLQQEYHIYTSRDPLYSGLLGGIAGTIAYIPLSPLDNIQTKLMADRKQKYVKALKLSYKTG